MFSLEQPWRYKFKLIKDVLFTLKQKERSESRCKNKLDKGAQKTKVFSNYVGEPRWDTWEATPFTRWTEYSTTSFIVEPCTFVDIAVSMVEFTHSTSLVELPLFFILSTTSPSENTTLLLGFTGSITAITLDF